MNAVTVLTRFGVTMILAELAFSSAAYAATINVPVDYPTIQAGINAAKAGDTVLIADGTYTGAGNVNLDFGGKAITVASQNGAAKTIIDLQHLSQGVLFHSGETAAAKLQGLTIENSSIPNNGGGISITGSSPTITGCALLNNIAPGGGGLFADSASNPTITNCTFTNNSASQVGGGMNLIGAGTVTGCTFANNFANLHGGGAFLNTKGSIGAVLTACTFISNSSEGNGGGVESFISFNPVVNTVTNCVFVGNSAANAGGAFQGTAVLTNCTIFGNTASQGAGIFLSAASPVTNCIIFGDTGTEIDAGTVGTISYCDVQGGYAGTGNVSFVPQFVNAPADLHLQRSSPLVHTGTSAGTPATDITGAVRPPTPSIGAYEIGPTFLPTIADSYVLSNAPTLNFGSAPTLSVGGFLGAAYLQFDLSSLAPLTSGSTARLHLNAGRPLAGMASLIVSATGSGWTEMGLTFSNRPARGLPLGFLNVTADGLTTAPYDLDVTPYVKAQQALGNPQIGLALTQFSPGLPVSIASKENPAGDGPQIIVTY